MCSQTNHCRKTHFCSNEDVSVSGSKQRTQRVITRCCSYALQGGPVWERKSFDPKLTSAKKCTISHSLGLHESQPSFHNDSWLDSWLDPVKSKKLWNTNLFHILTASPLADMMAVLSELKHTVLTSDLWPGSLNLPPLFTSEIFPDVFISLVSKLLLARSETICNEKQKEQSYKMVNTKNKKIFFFENTSSFLHKTQVNRWFQTTIWINFQE